MRRHSSCLGSIINLDYGWNMQSGCYAARSGKGGRTLRYVGCLFIYLRTCCLGRGEFVR